MRGQPASGAGPAGTSSRFRLRKVNLKAQLSVLREDEFGDKGEGVSAAESAEHENVQAVKTGVDESEEKEHHLQAVIAAAAAAHKGSAAPGGNIAQQFIPTPDAVRSDVPYDLLYPNGAFAQPATYIRFSSIVEDCIGLAYCMDELDDELLRKWNQDRSKGRPECYVDQFEAVMTSFEATTAFRQPFADVDNTPVLSLEEMAADFDDAVDDVGRSWSEDIYQHWKERRHEANNRSLMPKLKTLNIDRAQDSDDSDPYVCFRRREVRQARKTRGRDQQINEKLRRLRRELEDGRQLLHWVKNREEWRRDDLKISRQIFEQRAVVRDMKRNMNITEDDEELLINQKTPKRRPTEINVQHPSARHQQQLLRRQDSVVSLPDFEVVQYSDRLEQREKLFAREIERRVRDFEIRNSEFIDHTQEVLEDVWSLTDELEDADMSGWVGIQVDNIYESSTQQPTPPESVVDDSAAEEERLKKKDNAMTIRWGTPPKSSGHNSQSRMLFRQRHGRGGLMLDRRILRGRQQKVMDARTQELFKYDQESGEEDGEPAKIEPTDLSFFRLRRHLNANERRQQARAGGLSHSRSSSASMQSVHGRS